MTKPRKRRGLRFAMLAAVGVWAVALAVNVTGTFSKPNNNPPGANGVVKIDGIPFDQHPDNQPHVSCVFEVDFYNFDQGAYNADVLFTIHPPSGKGRVVRQDTVFVGEDPAGGGRDLDAEREYDLNMDVFASERHKQGFHIKLTVTAPGEGGKLATKHKVFWATDCIDP
jgi:hypothetical protein